MATTESCGVRDRLKGSGMGARCWRSARVACGVRDSLVFVDGSLGEGGRLRLRSLGMRAAFAASWWVAQGRRWVLRHFAVAWHGCGLVAGCSRIGHR